MHVEICYGKCYRGGLEEVSVTDLAIMDRGGSRRIGAHGVYTFFLSQIARKDDFRGKCEGAGYFRQYL
jgi:hypothetical protein